MQQYGRFDSGPYYFGEYCSVWCTFFKPLNKPMWLNNYLGAEGPFDTALQAMADLDKKMIARGYILCETESQFEKLQVLM